MKKLLPAFLVALSIGDGLARPVQAQESPAQPPAAQPVNDPTPAEPAQPAPPAAQAAAEYPPFAEVTKDFTSVSGLMPLYTKENRLLAEITPANLNRDLIVLISIARGIGEGDLLGGMSWGFGDDWLWQFRKVDENIQIVRRNVRFRANPGSPESRAVSLAYTDSILFSQPIITQGPSGGFVIDLTPVFFSDLPQIGQSLPGFFFNPQLSTWAEVKAFPDNLELEVAATYSSNGNLQLDTVPDSRGATINVHYSISALPQTGYQSRYADDRVGYFLTVIKDFSRRGEEERFIRYVNRWDLQKADPSAELSEPVKPIIFWLEKTIPFQYRAPIRDGILAWNKAFEQAGFLNAIEVRQQPDSADWDPEDINYNTFRWITAGAGFAMGPSRVNPTTGQILDADIIFDADFVEFWKEEYETFTPESIAALTNGPLTVADYLRQLERVPPSQQHGFLCRCDLHHGMSRELALGATLLSVQATGADWLKQQERLVMQGLKEVTMHEVGHTLGLRHNFKASAWRSLDEMNDTTKTADGGLTASVMDYTPVNLAPTGVTQGDYYSTTIGPYDVWAIEYGYQPLPGGTEGETAELLKIAARCAEPGLSFATDEDTRGIDPDPLSNRFDLGSDPIAYAEQRAKLVSDLWPAIVERVVAEGEGYQKARRAFGILLGNYGQSMSYAARFVGGIYVNRDHKGDANGRAPFVVVPADQQRRALDLLAAQVFSEKPFNFPPELYNHLASSRWNHWGVSLPTRPDYAVHEVIAMWQARMLAQLLSSLTLERLHDSELRLAADVDAFTTAELLEKLTRAIFQEVDTLQPGEYTVRKPAIHSFRRNLQRLYLDELSMIATGSAGAPADCRAVAYSELAALESRMRALLGGQVALDSYSRAHVQESADRIRKVLDANLVQPAP